MTPDWTRAACTKDPDAELEWFFPLSGGDRLTEDAGNRRARHLCRNCPIEAACLDYAVANHENGIWADTNDLERRAIRQRRHVA